MRPVFLLEGDPGRRRCDRDNLRLRRYGGGNGTGEVGNECRTNVTAKPTTPPSASRYPLPRHLVHARVSSLYYVATRPTPFLLLRATQLGVPGDLSHRCCCLLHLLKANASTRRCAYDRIGRKPTLGAGWILYAAVYAGFAFASAPWQAWALFAVYGVFFGLTEGTERALIADIVPAERRGSAYGWYHLAVGLGMFPASLLFGVIWDRAGAPTAFAVGAALALPRRGVGDLRSPERDANALAAAEPGAERARSDVLVFGADSQSAVPADEQRRVRRRERLAGSGRPIELSRNEHPFGADRLVREIAPVEARRCRPGGVLVARPNQVWRGKLLLATAGQVRATLIVSLRDRASIASSEVTRVSGHELPGFGLDAEYAWRNRRARRADRGHQKQGHDAPSLCQQSTDDEAAFGDEQIPPPQ